MGKTTKRNCSRKNKSMKNRKCGGFFSSGNENQSGEPPVQKANVIEEEIKDPLQQRAPETVETTSNPATKKGFLESITSFFSSSNPPSKGGKKQKKNKRKSSKK